MHNNLMKTTTQAIEIKWQPTAGKRAWWGGEDGQHVTVKRVHKGGTVTVEGWGRALLDGKLVTWRGIPARSLSAPRSTVKA